MVISLWFYPYGYMHGHYLCSSAGVAQGAGTVVSSSSSVVGALPSVLARVGRAVIHL